MQFKLPFGHEPAFDLRPQRLEVLPVVVDDERVVGVPEIMMNTQGFLDKIVEGIEICVGEQLGSQIADGQAAGAGGLK
jgi:hypothetical protein